MSRQDEIDKAQQFIAYGIAVQFLLAEHFKSLPKPPEGIANFLALAETIGDQMTYDHLDPAESDYAVQVLRDTLVRLGCRAASQATGQLFDPESYLRSYRPKSSP